MRTCRLRSRHTEPSGGPTWPCRSGTRPTALSGSSTSRAMSVCPLPNSRRCSGSDVRVCSRTFLHPCTTASTGRRGRSGCGAGSGSWPAPEVQPAMSATESDRRSRRVQGTARLAQAAAKVSLPASSCPARQEPATKEGLRPHRRSPPGRHARLQRPLQHGLGELPLGLEADLLRHVCLGTAVGVDGPFLEHVQLRSISARSCRWHRPRRPRPGSSRSARRCPSTGVAPRPTWCPPSGSRSRPLSGFRQVAELLHDVAAHVVASASASQRVVVNSCRIPSGVVSWACSASCQPFLRSTPPSSPRRNPAARQRTSGWANRGPIPLQHPLELGWPALDLGQHALPPPRSVQQKRATYLTQSAAAVLAVALGDPGGGSGMRTTSCSVRRSRHTCTWARLSGRQSWAPRVSYP